MQQRNFRSGASHEQLTFTVSNLSQPGQTYDERRYETGLNLFLCN